MCVSFYYSAGTTSKTNSPKKRKNKHEQESNYYGDLWMTSHYMSYVVKSPFEQVFNTLVKAFGNIYSKKFGNTNHSNIGIILGEQWFFRVNSDVAVQIILEELSSDETKIEVISCAGGAGWLSISYSAHSAYVHDVRNFLADSAFKIESEKEIPYFSDPSRRMSNE